MAALLQDGTIPDPFGDHPDAPAKPHLIPDKVEDLWIACLLPALLSLKKNFDRNARARSLRGVAKNSVFRRQETLSTRLETRLTCASKQP